MITYHIEHPTSWTAAVTRATASWPAVFEEWMDTGGDVAQIRGWFGDESLRGLPVPADDRSVTTLVVGRQPLAAPRISCWLKRTTLTVEAGDDRTAIDQWEVDEERASLEIGPGPLTPAIVRTVVRDLVRSPDPDRVDDIVLVASELAENAVEHGGGVADLHVHRGPRTLVIEVIDRSAQGEPAVRRTPVMSIAGRGMTIVDSVADHWGITLRAHSKTVWCEFSV